MNPNPKLKALRAAWLDLEVEPVSRLRAFQQWVNYLVAAHFRLKGGPSTRAKDHAALVKCVLAAVAELNERGWLLDGEPLESFLLAKLRELHRLHREGTIKALYPYWERAWATYVGEKAEELQGIAASFDRILHKGRFTDEQQPEDTIPALQARQDELKRDEALKKSQRKATKKKAEDAQTTLF